MSLFICHFGVIPRQPASVSELQELIQEMAGTGITGADTA
jgi:hypothetical protein